MEIQAKRVGEMAVFQLSGELSAGKSADLLEKAVQEGWALGCRHFIMDLSNLIYVNSSGLGSFMRIYQNVCSQGGDMCLANPQSHIRTVLDRFKKHPLFNLSSNAKLIRWGYIPPESVNQVETPPDTLAFFANE